MISIEEIAGSLSDKTRLKILKLLAEKSLSNTEIFKAMPEIKYRESVFKAIKRLQQNSLIKRKYFESLQGYKYSLAFKKIEVGSQLVVKLIK